jgi:amino acid transporter
MIGLGLLLLGARESSLITLVLTITNVTLILFIICYGSAYVHKALWTAPLPPQTPIPIGCSGAVNGGYFPCGGGGVVRGAARVFFSFVGFDSVATLAEEVSAFASIYES